MTGTFGGALEARGIPADSGKLYSESVGELEKDRGVLVIKRVHVSYVLKLHPTYYQRKRTLYNGHLICIRNHALFIKVFINL